MELAPLEAAVLRELLAGDDPILAALARQLPSLSVTSRRFSGAGFFTELTVADESLAVARHVSPFGEVAASVAGLKHDAGFVLFVERGLLRMLEGYSYGEPWTEHTDQFEILRPLTR